MKAKVLVIDDDSIATRITRARLESAGYGVITRNQSLGTAQAIITEQPDVVLLDLNMPALCGDAIAELMQSHPRAARTPVIFHSSEPVEKLEQKARAPGVIGYIQKTHDDDEFLRAFETVLARSRA